MRSLPDARFGDIEKPPVDWRKRPVVEPDDDAELPVTPPDVIAILGFDPKKE